MTFIDINVSFKNIGEAKYSSKTNVHVYMHDMIVAIYATYGPILTFLTG